MGFYFACHKPKSRSTLNAINFRGQDYTVPCYSILHQLDGAGQTSGKCAGLFAERFGVQRAGYQPSRIHAKAKQTEFASTSYSQDQLRRLLLFFTFVPLFFFKALFSFLAVHFFSPHSFYNLSRKFRQITLLLLRIFLLLSSPMLLFEKSILLCLHMNQNS